jgi:ATP-dependent RNA helicase HelY
MVRIWAGLEDREREHRLPVSGEPDAGLAWAMHGWARGQSLETVLRDSDLAAGDFVRRCKQLVDLLGQVADASSGPVRRSAHDAIERVRRGVVATN